MTLPGAILILTGMKHTALFLALALTIPTALCAFPNPFGPSQAEIKAALAKYCGAEAPSEDQAMALDLAALENRKDARALEAHFSEISKAANAAVAALEAKIKLTRKEQDRYFHMLYTKEVHDSVWHETRPIKQAAYRKSRQELAELLSAHDAARARAIRLADLAEALDDIESDFVEVKP